MRQDRDLDGGTPPVAVMKLVLLDDVLFRILQDGH